jgi:O-antigen/teichoic acid export membrane protein
MQYQNPINTFFSKTKTKKILYFLLPTYIGAALSLVTFPLVASKLGAQKYGQLDLFILLGTVLNFSLHLGWSSAHNRFYLKPEIHRSDLIKTLLVSRLVIICIAVFIVYSIQDWLLVWLDAGQQNAFMVWIVFGTFIFTELSQFHLQRYRMLNQARNYAFMALTKSLLYPLLLLPALFFLVPSPAIVLSCTFISAALPLVLVWLIDSKWLIEGKFNWIILKRTLRYGIPLVPAALAVMAFQITDRAMLRSLITDPEWSLTLLGYYAFALRLVSIEKLATSGFNILWSPYVWRTHHRKDSPLYYSYIFSTYLFVLTLLSLAIIILAQIFVPFLLPQYSPALPILSVLVASSVIYSIGDYFCIGIGIREKTWIRAASGGFSLVVNISLNFILIPAYGAMGAALATFIGTTCYVGFLMLASHLLW